MPKVWLQVVMERNPTDALVDLRFRIEKSDLERLAKGSLDTPDAQVQLNLDGPTIQSWAMGPVFLFPPKLRLLSSDEQKLYTNLFTFDAWRNRIKLIVSGQGPVERVTGGDDADYRCTLLSGAVTVWTLTGFDADREFFVGNASPFGPFDRWRQQMWPDARGQLAAVRFGAREIQIDVKDSTGRRRSTLVAERPDNRLWKLSDCATRENLLTPDQVIGALRIRISQALDAARWQSRITLADRPVLLNVAPAEVYYRVERSTSGGQVSELLRPDFDVVFAHAGATARWSPSMAAAAASNVELHDADLIAAEIAGKSPPTVVPPPAIRLKWVGTGVVPTLSEGQLPVARCVGISSGEVQSGFVWQYANTSMVPPGAPQRPALIRHAIPLDSRAVDSAPIPASLDAPIPIDRLVVPDGWRLELTPAVVEGAAEFSKTIRLTVWTDATRAVELALASGSLRADSPPLLTLATRLADPASLPNTAILSDAGSRGDPLQPTSLTFSSAVVESTDPVAQVQLTGSTPTFIVQASSAAAPAESVQVFWPHAPAALIDPVPAAARNLLQTRDIVTLRTIVERDFSHGSTAWGLITFRLRGDTRIRDRVGGAPMAMLDTMTGLQPLRAQLHSALSLLPWVACRDQLAGAASRQLHHRNLVLEPGEFAAASQDRSIDGRPMAFANTERDFIEAVRDPFTLAVAELPTAPSTAEIVHWLPGASLATPPAAKLVPATLTANLSDRFPAVELQDGLAHPTPQNLKVLFCDGVHPPSDQQTDWLTYNLRRAGWDLTVTPPRPRVELSLPGAVEHRWRRARNASVPPLFDDAAIGSAGAASLPGVGTAPAATWVCFGDDVGRIVAVDLARPTNRHFLRSATQQVQSGIRIATVAAVAATRWLIAIDGQGTAFVWQTSGELAARTPVASALPPLGIMAFGAACQAEGLIAFVVVNPAGGTAKLVIWDPTLPTSGTNPAILTTLPQVTPGNVRGVSLVADGASFLLAVAHASNPVAVLRAELQSGAWQLTPLTFAAAVTARLAAAAVVNGAAMIVTVENDADCKIWHEATPNQLSLLPSGNSMTAPARVTAASLAAWPVGTWMRPQADGVAAMLYLSTIARPAATPPAPADISGWRVPFESTPAANRRLPGVNGPANGLMAVELATSAIGERLPLVPRPHLLAYGLEGVCRIWDVDAEQAYDPIADHEDVFDNAGTLRTAHRVAPLSPIALGEWINRPGSVSGTRSDPTSNYAVADTIIEYSVAPLGAADALIRSTGDDEAITEIYLVCDRLRLCRQGTEWRPEAFPDDLDPGPDRPRLPFPFHRGPVGGYGMYSLLEGETEDLNYYPRLAGLPIHPTRVRYLKFAQTGSVTDFATISEIELEAVLPNPTQFGRREQRRLEYEIADLAAGADVPRTLLLASATPIRIARILLKPEGTSSGVDAGNPSTWRFVSGSHLIVEKTYFSAPFPTANVVYDLGPLNSTMLSNGRLDFTVTNGPTADLPRMKVIVEYFEPLAAVAPFVGQAIQEKSVIRVLLKRNSTGTMEIDSVSALDGSIAWNLPTTDAPVSANEELDGRLAQLRAEVRFERFQVPKIAGVVPTGRLVLRAAASDCQVDMLGGFSPLAGADVVLVGYGRRVTATGREFGFETPRFDPVSASSGMFPLPLLRTPDAITLNASLHALAVDELAASSSLVSVDANALLTWWDLMTGKPWSSLMLDSPAVDACAARVGAATVVVADGARLRAIDAELSHEWVPGAPSTTRDARTDWSDGEPIVALAACRDRIFVGTSLGRLLSWDDFGARKFALDLFAGPILQLAATGTPFGSMIAAVDFSRTTISLVHGETGAVLQQQTAASLFGAATDPIAQVALKCVGHDLVLAVLCREDAVTLPEDPQRRGVAALWRLPHDPGHPGAAVYLPAVRVCTTPGGDRADAIAIGLEGSDLALFYTADAANAAGRRVRRVLPSGTADDIGSSPGEKTAIDFVRDTAIELLVAIAPGAAISLWHRPRATTAWTSVAGITAVPEDPGSRLSASLERAGLRWTVAVGPGERLTDARGAEERIVQVFDATPTGTPGAELVRHAIPPSSAPAGLLGPRVTTALLPAPHAAVCRVVMPDTRLVDLRSGRVRFSLADASTVYHARSGHDDSPILITATQQVVSKWNLDRRTKLYEFDDGARVEAIAVDAGYAIKAAGTMRLWRHAQDPTAGGAETVQFGDAAWTPRRLALRVAETAILVAAATRSTADGSYRLEIWDVARPLAAPTLRLAWPVNGEVGDVVIVDESTIAISRRETGQPGVVDILCVSARDQLPVVRWRRQLAADAAMKLAALPGPAHARLVFDDETLLSAWSLAPRLRIASGADVDVHLPVELLAALTDVGTLSGDVVSGGKAYVYLTPHAPPTDLLRLHPRSVFRETFGFIAGPPGAGADSGNRAVCLWRNVQGNVAGSLLEETTRRRTVTLVPSGTAADSISVTAADFVELRFTAFNPDAAETIRSITTLSSRLSVNIGPDTLTLDIGEQRPQGDAAHPSEFFAHLTWKTPTFELQGPVRLRAAAAATRFTFVEGVYRLQPIQLTANDATTDDVVIPCEAGTPLNLNLAGGERRDTGPAGESLDAFYASLRLRNAGIQIRLVPDIDVPFDTCLDPGISGPVLSALPDVVQLVHRQVLGARLRHQAPEPGSTLLTANVNQAAPPHTALWGLAPIVQVGRRYRMLSSMVFVAAAASSASSLQTENLLLLSRDDTDTDELGVVVGLHNVTAQTEDRFLLDQADVDERLSGVEAAGAVVQRVLRGNEPALLRVVRRTASSAAASGDVPAPGVSTPVQPIDFRAATPRQASSMRRNPVARYLLDDPPIDAEIDNSGLAWRRFGIRDVQWADRPVRSPAIAQYGLLLSERTAFHRMAPPAPLPAQDQVFPIAPSAASFRPQSLEFQMGPDKPGALFHHAVHAFESATAGPSSTELPRPMSLVSQSLTDFALRDPLQLKPPSGADILIERLTRDDVSHRQAERIDVRWKETLGTILVRVTGAVVPLEQLGDLSNPLNWPPPDEVRVALTSRFLQLMVRVNEDIIEIDERQAQFPLYDARQSAATVAELSDRTKAFGGTDQPLPPEMDLPVTDVAVRSSSAGLWGLAVAQSRLRIWRLDVEDIRASTLPTATTYYQTHDSSPFVAEFAARLGQHAILCNNDGTQSGLFLRPVTDAGLGTAVQLSLTPTLAIRFVDFPSVFVPPSPDEPYPIRIEAYVACSASNLQLWYQRSDVTTPPAGPILIRALDPSKKYQLAAISMASTHPSAPLLEHHRLYIVLGIEDEGEVTSFQVDFSGASPVSSTLATVTAAKLTALAAAKFEGLVVFAGDAEGRTQCFDAASGSLLKQYARTASPVERISAGEASGRVVVAVTVGAQPNRPRIALWDAASGSLLRTTMVADQDYGVARAVKLPGGLHFLAAQTGNNNGLLQMFDPLLTPYRPPECFFVTRVPTLTSLTPAVRIKYMRNVSGTDTPTEVDIQFRPKLIMTDRSDPTIVYRSNLEEILEDSGVPVANGVRVLKLKERITGTAELFWERAGTIRIAWVGETIIGEEALEARFSTPIAEKQVKPVPYSAVAPKVAAVALADDVSSVARELWQKTALFGDAATAQGGRPALRDSGAVFAYEANDQETFDLPMTGGAARISLLLVKYLVNGQTIGTGAEATP